MIRWRALRLRSLIESWLLRMKMICLLKRYWVRGVLAWGGSRRFEYSTSVLVILAVAVVWKLLVRWISGRGCSGWASCLRDWGWGTIELRTCLKMRRWTGRGWSESQRVMRVENFARFRIDKGKCFVGGRSNARAWRWLIGRFMKMLGFEDWGWLSWGMMWFAIEWLLIWVCKRLTRSSTSSRTSSKVSRPSWRDKMKRMSTRRWTRGRMRIWMRMRWRRCREVGGRSRWVRARVGES